MDQLEDRLQEQLGAGYTIQAELGGGGMSRVFVADERALSRRVVIKVLHPTLAATLSAARFEREILLVAGLNHPHIVPVLTAGGVGGLPYFIMPFIDGESLRARITRGPLAVREALSVLKDVARALAYAHDAGVVHRDIKPGNILLTGSAAVVADFGVAKAFSAARERGVMAQGGDITGVGISLGTPQYMAPEQAAADPAADHRVDIYALGIVAYEMLTGSPPFHGRTPQALLAAQLTELPMPVAARRYDVPVGVASLVMQCLEKNPADRPRAASDVVRVLDDPATVGGPAAEPPRAASARRVRRVKTAAYFGVPVAIAVAATVWGLTPASPSGSAGSRAASAAPGGATPGVAQPAAFAQPVAITVDAALGDGANDLATGIVANLAPALASAGMAVASGEQRPRSVAAAGGVPADTAGYVVGITVQRQGARARATLRLTHRGAGTVVWTERFDFALTDAFAAQDSMAVRAVRALRAGRALPAARF